MVHVAVEAVGGAGDAVLPDVTNHLARALIEKHGKEALAVAKQAEAKSLVLGLRTKAAEWEQVIAAIHALLKRPPPPDGPDH